MAESEVEDHDEWDDLADGWDDSEAVRAYAAAAFDSLGRVLASFGIELDGLEVCDFGCGTGLLTERLVDSAAHVDAIDRSTKMLDVVNTKAIDNGWTNVETATEVGQGPPRYDLIVCSSVCSFLEDYAATAAQLVELLRPGGLFVQWDWEREPDSDAHGLSRGEIEIALTDAGLGSITVETAFEISMGDQVMSPLIGCGRR